MYSVHELFLQGPLDPSPTVTPAMMAAYSLAVNGISGDFVPAAACLESLLTPDMNVRP